LPTSEAGSTAAAFVHHLGDQIVGEIVMQDGSACLLADPTNNLIAQVVGRKRLLVLPASEDRQAL